MFLREQVLLPRMDLGPRWSRNSFREPEIFFFALPQAEEDAKRAEQANGCCRRHLARNDTGRQARRENGGKRSSPVCKRLTKSDAEEPKKKCVRREKADKNVADSWKNSLDFRGFRPGDVDVTVGKEGISLKGERVTRDARGFSTMAMSRFVTFPEDILKEKLNVWMEPNGHIYMEAPRHARPLEYKKPWERLRLERGKESEVEKMVEGQSAESETVDNHFTNDHESKDREACANRNEEGNKGRHEEDSIANMDAGMDDNQIDPTQSIKQGEEEERDTSMEGEDNMKDPNEDDLPTDTDGTRAIAVEQSVTVESIKGVATDNNLGESAGLETESESDLKLEKSDIGNSGEAVPSSYDEAIFKVDFVLPAYDPSNVKVKVVDRTVVIEADERVEKDGVNIANRLMRRFTLPKDVDTESIKSSLNDEGRLRISGSKVRPENKKQEIQISVIRG